MDLTSLLISLISGGVGGNVAGAASKENSLGTLGNTLAGLLGGGASGYIIQALDLFQKVAGPAGAAPGLDLGSIIGNIGTTGVSGAILTLVIGLIKNHLNKA